ncbi:MAG: hypothetical protein KAG61_12520 [Bacteriovoracaceae bacterium]|nr:hypothetical protein [Bacteriovoracaceae bacterium]
MKASNVREVAKQTSFDEILRPGKTSKQLKLKTRKKRNSFSRYSLDEKFEEKPLYKAEVIIDKFLNGQSDA